MRIAHVAHTFWPAAGGAEAFIHGLALRQASHHRPVVIVRWNKRRTALSRLGYPVIPLLPTTLRRALELDGARRWHRLIKAQVRMLQRRYRFDIWHFHQPYPDGWAMAPMLDAIGVPSVLTYHGGGFHILGETRGAHGLDQRRDERMREGVRRFHGLAAISNTIESYFLDAGAELRRIRRIMGGVDVARLEQRPDVRAMTREALGLSGPVLITVSTDRPEKGLDLIPSIADALARSVPEFTWLVVGPSPRPGWAARVPSNVRLLPRKEPDLSAQPLLLPPMELASLYWAADLLVMLSRVEGLPMAVLEGMAAGLPVATTDAPGCIDLVTDGVNGLVSPVDNTDAMATNIARLLARPEERAAMAAASRRLSHDLEWDTVVGQYEDFYRDVIGRSRRNPV